ncbi:BamA/OMP85 family outer membrane protein [Engelhardtia mirabilis]|uniref:Outer membrane protein assembly factor BamA n=1 Tax=Engelhardtia mirabilis TaxID=2528011 RepID=A0A518BPJ1_9BACT|nr:Outer membrane protein assembly factor BamA precursor [Planctomycetes bacterium Pla133]QDV03215.1 Outer membrane protein assembly factor BamA precursor [Planctomycetes bacterium Pla86]
MRFLRLDRGAARALACLGLLGTPAMAVAVQVPPSDGLQGQAAAQPQVVPAVVAIDVYGHRRVSADQIRAAFAQKVGAPYDESMIARGIEVLWRTFGVRAEVSRQELENGVRLRIDVTEVPFDFTPRFEGNERVDTRDLLEWADLAEGGELYQFEIPRVQRALEEAYTREGYHFAVVRAVERDLGEGRIDVVFEIDEGPLVCVEDLVIHGNESLPDRGFLFWREGLRAEARPQLRAPVFFGLFGKAFDRNVLEADLIAIREAYRREGYLDAVVQLEQLEFNEGRDWVTIHLRVDEGAQFTVGSVRIEGYDEQLDPTGTRLRTVPTELLIPEDELLELCELKTGATYSQLLIDIDQRALRDRYGRDGHVAHRTMPLGDRWRFLPPELNYDLETSTVDVVYRLAQGREQFIREVRLTGNASTRDRVLRSRISIQPGDVADLVEIDRSLQRIRSTGYFSTRFNIANHPEPIYQFVATEEPNYKDLEFIVEEGDLIQVDFGIQYGADSGGAASIGLSFNNFDISRPPSWNSPFSDIYSGRALRGAGQTFNLFASPGTEESTYQISFTEPDLFARHYDRIGLSASLGRRLRSYSSHTERHDYWSLDLTRALTQDTRVSIGFSADEVLIDDLATGGEPSITDPLGVPDLLGDEQGHNTYNAVTLGMRYGRSNRALQPDFGFLTQGNLKVYSNLWGSDGDWSELTGLFEKYGRFDPIESTWGYRVRTRAGVAQTYGDTDNVPFSQRFFLGGSSLMRGFALRGVGPIDDGFSIGGETYVAGSLDVYYPLVRQPIPGTLEERDVLRIGTFVDAAILDPDEFQLDPNELRVSAGFTFGVLVPIPITLSFGFPVRAQDEDLERVFSLNFFI